MENRESIILGGGCFWCLEAVYQEVPGVIGVISGYCGGTTPDPDYRSVCGGRTGHAEAVLVTFDPSTVSLERLLDIFWVIHDPTTPDRQGGDVGTQYRSLIMVGDARQEETARHSMAAVRARFADPIVTQIVPRQTFYPAEAYHQNYFRTHPKQGYCMAVVAVKVAKYRTHFQGEA